MSVYYSEPFFSFSDLSRFFDDTMHMMRPGPGGGPQQMVRAEQGERSMMGRGFAPKVDICESPEQNRVMAVFELPGMSKENVNIDVQNCRLVISGEMQMPMNCEEKGMVHCQRRYGRFSRSVPLPQGIKPAEVQAKMENGLLVVTFPKVGQEQKPQRVSIE